jgi:hypothetical protein
VFHICRDKDILDKLKIKPVAVYVQNCQKKWKGYVNPSQALPKMETYTVSETLLLKGNLR